MPKPRLIADLELRARRKRFELFANLLSALNTGRSLRILDVGGTQEYWSQLDLPKLDNLEIVLLNVFPPESVRAPFTAVVGDPRDLSRFRDGDFDIVYSNSVICLV